MAKTYTDAVYGGTLTTNSVTVVTVATATVFIVKGIVISNANSAGRTAEILIDDIRILPFVKNIPSGEALILDNLSIPIIATKTIKLKGEVITDMDYYIWGQNEVTT